MRSNKMSSTAISNNVDPSYCFQVTIAASPPKRVLGSFETTNLSDATPFEHHPAKLFVGSIAGTTTKEDLIRMFSAFGPIVEVVILVEKDGRPKFSAFINMKKRADAEKAIAALDRSHTIPGAKKILEVRFAQNGLPKAPVQQPSSPVNKTERSFSTDTSDGTEADSSVGSPRLDCLKVFSVKVGDSHSINASSEGYEVSVLDAYSALLTWLELTELGLHACLVPL
jgi:RNA recognition motif-containing protein